jgi:hypothetical protein
MTKPDWEVADPRIRDLLKSVMAALGDPALNHGPDRELRLGRRMSFVVQTLVCLLDAADPVSAGCDLDQTIIKLKLEVGGG